MSGRAQMAPLVNLGPTPRGTISACSGTKFEDTHCLAGRWRTVAMKDLYAALGIATAIAAGAGLTIKHVAGTDYYCPPPTAASVATLFAPCQAFDTAVG